MEDRETARGRSPRLAAGYHPEGCRIGSNVRVRAVALIKLLSPKLKTSLIGIDLLGALNSCVNIINKRYNNILRLILKPAP
jgi:hypothetical protein